MGRLRHSRRCDAELVAESKPERVVGEQGVRAIALPGEHLRQEPRAALAQRSELDEPAGSSLRGRRLCPADPEGREPGEFERAHQQRADFPAPFLCPRSVLAREEPPVADVLDEPGGTPRSRPICSSDGAFRPVQRLLGGLEVDPGVGGQLDPQARPAGDRNDAPDLGEEGAQRRFGCVGCRVWPEQLHERGGA